MVLEDYLRAQREDRWQKACTYLSAGAKAPLNQIISQFSQIESCGQALRISIANLSERGDPYVGTANVASMRIKRGGLAGEGSGFALFHGEDGFDYWVTMRREGGQWKVGSITPQRL